MKNLKDSFSRKLVHEENKYESKIAWRRVLQKI